ncbi:endonuclease V isoform X3 [Canna indica]|uniref:Endonuclease V isoform X3 n=1 Tax=Canna indica TaxID=4628 RepID=A0AAQ3QC68_9LILI|nr:endonuclease V isoform X3 [Canna indica]
MGDSSNQEEDDFSREVPSQGWASEDGLRTKKLKYIGGVDISFLKEDPSVACSALVVLDGDTLKVVHEEFDVTRLQVPYVPNFLAFREAPILLGFLEKMMFNVHPFFPQLGLLSLIHYSGLGLACHLGILSNLSTIGIGKNLHHVDGLTQSAVRQCLEARENCIKDMISLTGKSGKVWGMDALKFNCDVLFVGSVCDIGFILRNSEGVCLLAQGNFCVELEARAIKWALQSAIENAFTSFTIESDSKIVIDALNLVVPIPWAISTIMDDINYLKAGCNIFFSFCFREANEAAH